MKIELNELAKVLAQTRGRGLSMKQLAAQLAPGQDVKQQVRKGLAQLIREGRAVTDGQIYRAPSIRKPEAGEGPRKPEQGRGEPRRPEPGRGESRKAEPGRGESRKAEPGRGESRKAEPGRGESRKAEPGRGHEGRGESRRNGPGGGVPRGKGGNRRAHGESAHAPNGDGARGPGREPGSARPRAPDAVPGRPAAMLEGSRQRRERGSEKAKGPRELVGTLTLKPEGYGFVSPLLGGPRDEDLFIPPRQAQGAMDGDVVRARAVPGRDGRSVGEILEVVETRRQLALGTYCTGGKAAWVEPHDRVLTQNIVVPRDPRARDGEMVKVRLRRDEAARQHGELTGEVIAVLGPRGDARYEILATAYAFGFSDEFDPATLLAAEGVPDRVRPEDAQGRRDLRSLPLVTIDGEDARDFDDAVHVARTPHGYRLVVAIADVAHYVPPNGALDREALRRATSVYFPGTVLPMLPERLSNGICSLNPDVDRLCMVCDLALDETGRPLHADIYDAVMRSHARLTYTQVAEALSGHPSPELKQLLPDLQLAGELAKKMTAQRKERGSIDFDLPEPKIVLKEDGTVLEIAQRPRNDAHRLVEEFMLAANEGVARFFDARGLPTVYRIHDEPDDEKLASFAALAQAHGFSLPEKLTPKALNDFLQSLAGKPQQKALNSLLLRAMMQAQYSPENIGHYGLAAPTYLHFTSPIRRYPDLMVHRLLKEHWARAGRALREAEREELSEYLAGIAAQCSERERASMKAERDIDAYYAAVFMQDKVGEEYDAVVGGVAEIGLFCELEGPSVEGLLPATELGDGVVLDPELHRLVVGTTGKAYGVGDELRVRVASADPVKRRIGLVLAGAGAGRWPAHAEGDGWLRPDDLAPGAMPAKKRRPPTPGPQRGQPGQRPPPRGSPPGRSTRHKGRRGRGR
jgi:ribonuclease R